MEYNIHMKRNEILLILMEDNSNEKDIDNK